MYLQRDFITRSIKSDNYMDLLLISIIIKYVPKSVSHPQIQGI